MTIGELDVGLKYIGIVGWAVASSAEWSNHTVSAACFASQLSISVEAIIDDKNVSSR